MCMRELESTSAPAIIDDTDFDLDDKERNLAKLSALKKSLSSSAHPATIQSIMLGDGSRAKLFKTGDEQSGAVFIEYRGLLGLYVKYTTWRYAFLPVRTLTQTRLWRSKTLPVTNTFSQRLFFNSILGFTGAVLSDAEHTEAGQEFWKRRLREALQKRLNVALVDFAARSYEQVAHLKQLEDLLSGAWAGSLSMKPRFKQLRWLIWK